MELSGRFVFIFQIINLRLRDSTWLILHRTDSNRALDERLQVLATSLCISPSLKANAFLLPLS